MERMKRIFLTLAFLTLASVACMQSALPVSEIATPSPTFTPFRIHSATPVNTATPYLQKPTKTPLPQYTVTGLVHIRDFEGEHKGYKHPGDLVTCLMSGDWCLLEDGTKIWAGCLEPGNGKGCGAK